jgi:hypothetical protein
MFARIGASISFDSQLANEDSIAKFAATSTRSRRGGRQTSMEALGNFRPSLRDPGEMFIRQQRVCGRRRQKTLGYFRYALPDRGEHIVGQDLRPPEG